MKKYALIMLVMCLLLVTAVTFTACFPKVIKGNASYSKDYDASQVGAKMDELRVGGGLRLVYSGTLSSSADGTENITYSYAANGDLYYFAVNDEQIYYDLSNSLYAVEYHKNGDSEWAKTIIYYTDDFTKSIEEGGFALLAKAMVGWLGYYGDEANKDAEGMKKETAEIAGRSCDKYSWGVSLLGQKVSYSCYIDQQTGFCMKWESSVFSLGQGAGANFECQTFEDAYTFGALPEVSDDTATIIDARTGGEGNGEDSGTTDGDDEGGSEGAGKESTGTPKVSLTNDYPNYTTAIGDLIATTGVEWVAEADLPNREKYTVIYKGKGGLWYYYDGYTGTEVYADLTNDNGYVLYKRTAPTEEWTREWSAYRYNETGKFHTKWAVIRSMREIIFNGIYEAVPVFYLNEITTTKEQGTYLGRDVDKYTWYLSNNVLKKYFKEVVELGADPKLLDLDNVTETIVSYIDQETGVTLFKSIVATAQMPDIGIITCKSFKLGDDVSPIVLPILPTRG